MEPFWLQVAGDAGSALGGLTVFGAAIGWLLRARADAREDMRMVAQGLDALEVSLENVSVVLRGFQRGELDAGEVLASLDKEMIGFVGLDAAVKGHKLRPMVREIRRYVADIPSLLMETVNPRLAIDPRTELKSLVTTLKKVRGELLAGNRRGAVRELDAYGSTRRWEPVQHGRPVPIPHWSDGGDGSSVAPR